MMDFASITYLPDTRSKSVSNLERVFTKDFTLSIELSEIRIVFILNASLWLILNSSLSYKEKGTKSIENEGVFMRRVAFHTLGCKVNTYETEAMQEMMKAAGYTIVDFEDCADVYVINTCSVTNVADKKSRQMLHRAKKINPDAIVVAAGCYVQADAEKVKKDEKVDIIIGNNVKKDIVQIIDEYLSEKKPEYLIDINATNEFENLFVSEISDHTRAFIKIQDGCNQFCSYCIIPFTRGRVRSRKSEDILREVEQLSKKGYKEMVLTGIHLTSYGFDFSQGEPIGDLLSLIQAIGRVKGVERIRIGSLEPRIITEEFICGLKEVEQFCPHFHLSLQSGSDDTLQRMNRKYSAEEFRAGVEIIRKFYPLAAITTDIIVGFPGETEKTFQESYDFVKEIGFFEMHIFPYSVREGTKAAQMKNQLTQKEKSERALKLAKLNEEMSKQFRQAHLGREEWVLLEEEVEIEGKKYMIGHTKEYLKVAVKGENLTKNSLVCGKISSFLTSEVMLIEKNAIAQWR